MEKSFRRILSLVCAIALAEAVVAPLIELNGSWHADVRNRDGRPDSWRLYDARGALIEFSIDTNFDGRWDIRERYTSGMLLRRDLDRNFDDRVDLVEYFDPDRQEHNRSILDTGFDGHADLLVLFENGHPVYSRWAASTDQVGGAAVLSDDHSLADPFARQTALRSVSVRAFPPGYAAAFRPISAPLSPPNFACP